MFLNLSSLLLMLDSQTVTVIINLYFVKTFGKFLPAYDMGGAALATSIIENLQVMGINVIT